MLVLQTCGCCNGPDFNCIIEIDFVFSKYSRFKRATEKESVALNESHYFNDLLLSTTFDYAIIGI